MSGDRLTEIMATKERPRRLTLEDVEFLINEVVALRLLVEDLADYDDCVLDHDGDCQTHAWFSENPCADGRAQLLIAEWMAS